MGVFDGFEYDWRTCVWPALARDLVEVYEVDVGKFDALWRIPPVFSMLALLRQGVCARPMKKAVVATARHGQEPGGRHAPCGLVQPGGASRI